MGIVNYMGILNLYLRPKITGYTTISTWNTIPRNASCIFKYTSGQTTTKLFTYKQSIYRLELRSGYIVESSICLVHIYA